MERFDCHAQCHGRTRGLNIAEMTARSGTLGSAIALPHPGFNAWEQPLPQRGRSLADLLRHYRAAESPRDVRAPAIPFPTAAGGRLRSYAGAIPPPRIAYFPDSFHEVNGVAHTSRNFAAYAERHGLPFLCIRASAGAHTASRVASRTGELRGLDLRRSAIAVRMEKDLQFDPLFWRHGEEISQQLYEFQPDIIHTLRGRASWGSLARTLHGSTA